MKRRKIFILCGVGALIFLGVIIFARLSSPDDDGSRYEQLLRARRLEARFTRWSTTAAYRWVARVTKSDPVEHFRTKSDQLENALCKSGALVGLNFYTPSPLPQMPTGVARSSFIFVNQGSVHSYVKSFVPAEAFRESDAQCARWGLYSAVHINVICRPQDAAFWRSANCHITNRLDLASLKNFAGDPDRFSCLLPDGSFVDFDVGQSWLNQSIAEGWMVGAEFQPEQWSDSRLVLYRRRPGGKLE